MEYKSFESPFPHIEIEDLISEEENNILYNKSLEYLNGYEDSLNDLSYFVLEDDKHLIESKGIEWVRENGYIQNNTGIRFDDTEVYSILQKIKNRLGLIHYKNLNLFPDEGKIKEWHVDLTISNEYSVLHPHTDYIYDIGNDMKISKEEVEKLPIPLYKGLLYIGDSNIEYEDYGTKFYEKIIKGESFRYSELKEVKFIPRNAHFFKTEPNSYHGTDFKSGFPHKRIFVAISYS